MKIKIELFAAIFRIRLFKPNGPKNNSIIGISFSNNLSNLFLKSFKITRKWTEVRKYQICSVTPSIVKGKAKVDKNPLRKI